MNTFNPHNIYFAKEEARIKRHSDPALVGSRILRMNPNDPDLVGFPQPLSVGGICEYDEISFP